MTLRRGEDRDDLCPVVTEKSNLGYKEKKRGEVTDSTFPPSVAVVKIVVLVIVMVTVLLFRYDLCPVTHGSLLPVTQNVNQELREESEKKREKRKEKSCELRVESWERSVKCISDFEGSEGGERQSAIYPIHNIMVILWVGDVHRHFHLKD